MNKNVLHMIASSNLKNTPPNERFEWRILVRIVLLLISLTALAFFLVKGWTIAIFLTIPLAVYVTTSLYQIHLKAFKEIYHFVEAVKYRDFSLHYNDKQGPLDVQYLRKGFNEINTYFRQVSREKETQYQYLQNILQLVNTGILSYNEQTGDVAWFNESLKKTIQLPFLKSIHSLKHRNEDLYHFLMTLKVGESKVKTVKLNKNTLKLLISATGFQTDDKRFKLIAFQNINEALDQTETQAWQQLLSVLTHEIMNSIAPISSVADTLKNRLSTLDKTSGNGIEDIEVGIDTIKRRSEGLLKFADVYRNLNKIAKPDLKKFYVRDLFENIHQLMNPTLIKKNIEVDVILKDPNLLIEADAALLEQVLINLLVNAIDAVKEKKEPHIAISASQENEKTFIKIADNGTGMPPEVVEKIFIPFFTSKKNGSGIGLTLCKQIMMMHHGNIQVHSVEGEGTAFILQF
jgi:two-component system, NtrC family, nitrogen regulation sensor histidine kinase NtrY